MPGPPPTALLHLVPSRHPDLAWRNWDGEVIILTPAGHEPSAASELLDGAEHDLNPVASRIFELCDGTLDVAGIVRQVVLEFEVETQTAEADTLAFVQELVGRRFLLLGAKVPPAP
jgi:hypothetical protein